AKAAEIADDPRVALTFDWPTLGRQVRVQGRAMRSGDATSAADFAARSGYAQAVVLAAHDLASTGRHWTRQDLTDAANQRLREQPGGLSPAPGAVPWAAYAVRPERVEFWQADPGRRHQRVACTPTEAGWATAVIPH